MTKTSTDGKLGGSKPRSAWRWGVGLVVLAMLVTVSILIARRPGTAKPIEEIVITNIFRTNGLVFKKGESKPFSGALLDLNHEGQRVSRTEMKDGLINGVSEGWYTNGVLQVREHFVNGVEEGMREKWHADGVPMLRGGLVGGKFEGVFQRWHTNGQLAEAIFMRGGKPDGEATSYYPSGYKKTYVVLKDGVVLKQTSWKDGEEKVSEPKTNN